METKPKARICVPVCEQTVQDLSRAIKLAAELGDLVEIRLDCLDPLEWENTPYTGETARDASQTTPDAGGTAEDTAETPQDELHSVIANIPVLIIQTLRPAEQGGQRELDHATRLEFWSNKQNQPTPRWPLTSQARKHFQDVELDLAAELNSLDGRTSAFDWSSTICSHHDFHGVAANLDEIYERMRSTPARILKIAVQANDVTDCLPIFSLLDRARKDDREMIALAMGTAGVPTRILGPSRGAFLTYGALNVDDATAPGQITASQLRHLYRIDKITAKTQIVGIVGLPVSQSVSPQMHNAAFALLNVDAVYMPFEVHDLTAFMKRMIHPRSRELDWNLRGLSITAPYKSQIIEWLDWIDLPAKEIGAINTMVIENGRLRGYNTDVIGFIKPLMQRVGNLRDARCALIGAGGTAKSVLWGMRQHGSNTTVFARDEKKAALLADKFGARLGNLSNARLDEFDVVINATPLGMRGPFEKETPLSCDQLRGAHLAYDLVYNPVETRFLREAREAGCETLGGLGMFLAQADEQFRLWTGLEPPQHVMRDAAVEALAGL